MLPTIEDADGILPVLSFQAITVPVMEEIQKDGGNALSLHPTQGPLFICDLAILWSEASDNSRIMSSEKKGLNNDFIYMKYTSPYQNVTSNYGIAKKQKLKTIAGNYNPPAHFKLEGAPHGAFPRSGRCRTYLDTNKTLTLHGESVALALSHRGAPSVSSARTFKLRADDD
ncbi:hypothetical protein BDW02DRAFT_566934 [Decorospora gaudefroyi]|uniref:Uncharacterized protein n=1 Tax=Decorospora gaudefroyi TaxID=184978 RepID=A0A6A5KKT7_9PLEO|nr:hypothetical protein BDW02DRAFT_566934 [Decorospora gaudefroyi]